MRPSFLDSMSWEMAEVYGAVTDRILVNLAHYFPYAQMDEQVLGSFEYQARMLAQMGQVTKETVDIIVKSLAGADQALRDALEASITEALKNEEPKLRQAAKQGMLGMPVTPEVTPNQMNAFQSYYRQSADKLNLVNTVMLESTQAAYSATVSDISARIGRTQSILNIATGETVTGVTAYNSAVRSAVKKMVDNGLTGFIDHAGHHWSPEAYVAMDVRTTMFNTARSAIWERENEYGVDTYQVSSHNGARPLCYPWQGKVISRTDWEREVEDLDGTAVHVYPQSVTSYGKAAGLFGVNCGHYPMTFIPGFSTLKGEPQDPEENAETYAESQQQRALERKLREEKRDLAVMKAQGAPEEEIRAQRERVKKASQDIDDFCDETGRTRKKSREYIPVNASFKGAKTPPYGVPVSNVINEYRATAKPGIGNVIKEKGYKSENEAHETKVANDLLRQFGGDVVQIRQSKGEPDYRWRGKLWEVKETSSANSVDKQTEKALNQTSKYGGNVIIDYVGEKDIDLRSIVLNRVRRSAKHSLDIFVLRNGKIEDIYRYIHKK